MLTVTLIEDPKIVQREIEISNAFIKQRIESLRKLGAKSTEGVFVKEGTARSIISG